MFKTILKPIVYIKKQKSSIIAFIASSVFSLFQKSYKKITIDFIIGLLPNKYYNIVYNSILIIVDRYIKAAHDILIIKKIINIKLANIFFEKIVLKQNIPYRIINNKSFIFISAFWFLIYYYIKIKYKLNITFCL